MNTASLKKEYAERIVPSLMKEFNYKSVMQVPVLDVLRLIESRFCGDDDGAIERTLRPQKCGHARWNEIYFLYILERDNHTFGLG